MDTCMDLQIIDCVRIQNSLWAHDRGVAYVLLCVKTYRQSSTKRDY